MSDFEYDVFLSHASADKAAVRELAQRLKGDGLRVWFDEWVIQPGDMVSLKIEKGLECSRTLVLVMSEAAFDSEWVTLERHTALFRDPTNQQRRFIPLRLDDSDIKDSLKQFAYVDWRRAAESAYQELLRICKTTLLTEPTTADATTVRVGSDDLISCYARARANPRLYEFLYWLYKESYGEAFLQEDGVLFPVLIYRASQSQQQDLESPIRGLLDHTTQAEIDSRLASAGEEYIRLRTDPSWDDRTYRAVNIELSPELRISCALGRYLDTLRTCDVLEHELLCVFGSSTHDNLSFEQTLSNALPLRRHVHQNEESLLTPYKRSVGIAISTLIVYADNGVYKALIRQRSRDVAVHQNLLHVVPSFMFQPMTANIEEEFNVRHNIYREYLEEVFRRDDLERPSSHVNHRWFYNDPNLAYLESLEKEGQLQLAFTGIAVNLLNLRLEICTLLLIRDPTWFVKQGMGIGGLDRLNTNWEFAYGDGLEENLVGMIGAMNLGSSPVIPSDSFRPEYFVPPAAAALELGVTAAQELLLAGAIEPKS